MLVRRFPAPEYGLGEPSASSSPVVNVSFRTQMQKDLLDEILEMEPLSRGIRRFYSLTDIAKELFMEGMQLFTPPATRVPISPPTPSAIHRVPNFYSNGQLLQTPPTINFTDSAIPFL